jgi:acyl-CoA synthetase (AMP-forming)/AMP-acid ligase II
MKLADDDLQNNASLLKKGGTVVPNQIVALYFDNHRDNIIWFWSVIAAGAVPAVLQPFSNNLKTMADQVANIDRILQSPTVITSQHLALHFKPLPSIKTITIQRIHYDDTARKMSMQPQCLASSELASIYFTSGSTGHSKAVEFSHSQLIASVEAKTRFHGTKSDWNFLAWCCMYYGICHSPVQQLTRYSIRPHCQFCRATFASHVQWL